MSIGALNSRTLNVTVLDGGTILPETPTVTNLCLGEFNAAPMDSWTMNDCIFYAVIPSQTVVSIEQQIGVHVAQTVITFVQSQELRLTASGTVFSLQQNVKTALPASNVIELTQVEVNAASFFTRYEWDAAVSINGAEIAKDKICSGVTITRESNQNTLCEFKVLSSSPLDFINTIDGGSVVINYLDSDGGHRLFTGVVDLPEVDLINKYITVKCSDRREELIKAKMMSVLPTIGRYSQAVQGDITSVGQEMEYRLQTTPKDVDFDSYNTVNVNSWYSKATADYVFSSSSVYYRDPRLTLQSRGGAVNDVAVEIKYQYPRLYHYQRPFTWTTSAAPAGLVSGGHQDAYSFPTVGMIHQAIDGAGWRDNNTLAYTESLSNYWVTYTMVQPNTMRPYIGGAAFTAVRVPMIHHLEDQNAFEVTTASWSGSTRFAETVEETYTLTVHATQSISQYGSLTAFSNYNVKEDYDTGTWESYKQFTAQPSGAVTSNDSYYIDKDLHAGDKINAVLTAVDKAKTQILASHRDTKVQFQTLIQPDLELRHTVEVDTDRISCKGKVVKIVHVLDLIDKKNHSTDVTLSLFRSQGSGSTTGTTCPAKPSDSVNIPSSTITLGNHLGYDYDSMPVTVTQTWNGFVGNTIDPPTQFTERFIVDTPSAPAGLRDLRALTASSTYNVAIPNDDLDINF